MGFTVSALTSFTVFFWASFFALEALTEARKVELREADIVFSTCVPCQGLVFWFWIKEGGPQTTNQ